MSPGVRVTSRTDIAGETQTFLHYIAFPGRCPYAEPSVTPQYGAIGNDPAAPFGKPHSLKDKLRMNCYADVMQIALSFLVMQIALSFLCISAEFVLS